MARLFLPLPALTYLNLHTHHPVADPDVLEIENQDFSRPESGATPYRSAGLHPWYLDAGRLVDAARWLETQAALPSTLAVGETGLDKRTTTPWPLQQEAFESAIRVAARVGKPLIIHCVKAYEEVLRTLAQLPAAHRPAAIFHGFDKHPQTAQMLLGAGYYLSFGAALFRDNSPAAEALRQTPAERFFLETDDRQVPISDIYARAADILGLSEEIITEQVWENFHNVFHPLFLPRTNRTAP